MMEQGEVMMSKPGVQLRVEHVTSWGPVPATTKWCVARTRGGVTCHHRAVQGCNVCRFHGGVRRGPDPIAKFVLLHWLRYNDPELELSARPRGVQ